jgi:hypothetical protein
MPIIQGSPYHSLGVMSQNHIRQSIVDEIKLLAHPSMQLEYESSVPIANVYNELVCGFCDDLYHPKSELFISSFTEDELKQLAHLYGVLCQASDLYVINVTDLLKNNEWRAVITVAQKLHTSFNT